MNEQELLKIWKSYDEKLEDALAVNRSNTIAITRLKVSSELNGMKPMKWFAIACGVIWCFVLFSIFGLSLVHTPPHFPFILFMLGLTAINVIGVGIYIYHLVLISRVNNHADIVSTQRELASLKSSTMLVTKILLLQTPFYGALHLFIAKDAGALFWVINGLIIAALVALTVWLVLKINYKNRDQRWFQFLFNDCEWNGVIRSIEMLDQIEEHETVNN